MGRASPEKARPGKPSEQPAWARPGVGVWETEPGLGTHRWRQETVVALKMGHTVADMAGGYTVPLDSSPVGPL